MGEEVDPMRLRWIVLPSCLLLACAAPDNDTEPDPEPVVATAPPEDYGGVCEPVDEAADAFSVCSSACGLAAIVGCAGAVSLCLGTEALTVGGSTVPCVLLASMACTSLGSNVGACTQAFCGGA
jgi:hypothetical protein